MTVSAVGRVAIRGKQRGRGLEDRTPPAHRATPGKDVSARRSVPIGLLVG